MIAITLPRFVSPKTLAGGRVGFFWSVPAHWRRQRCPYSSAPLGSGLGQAQLDAAAKVWNDRFDEWRRERRGEIPTATMRYGTVAWLVEEYLRSDVFKERVAEGNRADYRLVLDKVVELPTEEPGRWPNVGALPVKSISPAAADKLYAKLIAGGKYRKGEKAVSYCKTAWDVIGRLHPDQFNKDVRITNPWVGVTMKRRIRKKKPAVDRETVYRFAWGAIEAGRPELGAAAVICFEWLQRPMNVVAGHIGWGDYRSAAAPDKIRIEHHKTGETVLHPLDDGDVRLYEEAEEVLGHLPRRGTMMILGPQGQRYKPTRFAQLVRSVADDLGLPTLFSLDACRHGGMTELEEAELTEGQGMALSAHKTPRSYRSYAKRTEARVLAATRRRMAYRIGNVA